jgi:Na+/H+ antiporter NhaD/arsenite permease-like protein
MTTVLIVIFIVGYLLITLEHKIRINKAATALMTGALCWTAYVLASPEKEIVGAELEHHLGQLSGILFFLLGAMTIVEIIDAHDGFEIITTRISQRNKVKLMWIVCFIAFFLSAVLDNLTTSIVMVSLLRKLIKDKEDRWLFIGMVIIAANAGGAWSPIGDVTTTMLWIGGQITTLNIITKLIIPCIACLVVPLLILSFILKGTIERPAVTESARRKLPLKKQLFVLFSGIVILIFVPVFKTLTGLPPYMGILLGLGVLWILTGMVHRGNKEDKQSFSVEYALRKIDTPSILFFFGILVSVAALESAGLLTLLANKLNESIASEKVIVLLIGALSAIIDNVPMVAAVQGMYDLSSYPQDHPFWELLSYSTGTGGSALIIGTAAGVAAMGMENITFNWYLRKISLLAIAGYAAGAGVYLLQEMVF